jgi:protein-L-isoaspartate(D-aspartate) O-methyltransferase
MNSRKNIVIASILIIIIVLVVMINPIKVWISSGFVVAEDTPQPVVKLIDITKKPQKSPTADDYSNERDRMVEFQIQNRGVNDALVLEAMHKVPRHEFVLDHYLHLAYSDTPLPINYGQTISQPYMVALMSELLQVKAGDRVLEIGTGSGYQAAILAEMGIEVFTIEIIPELAVEVRQRLDDLGYNHIQTLNADGYFGWEEFAPYNAIIVTAAPDHLPQPLVSQLVDSGRLVIPIGPVGAVQTLWLFEKNDVELLATNMGSVRFVPLTGEHPQP